MWGWRIAMRSRLRLALPVVVELAKAKYAMKKDSGRGSLSSRVVVDFTPKGFLGDIWLCVYYFFATILPNNWGPRVFRDWLCLFPDLFMFLYRCCDRFSIWMLIRLFYSDDSTSSLHRCLDITGVYTNNPPQFISRGVGLAPAVGIDIEAPLLPRSVNPFGRLYSNRDSIR